MVAHPIRVEKKEASGLSKERFSLGLFNRDVRKSRCTLYILWYAWKKGEREGEKRIYRLIEKENSQHFVSASNCFMFVVSSLST